MNIDPSLDTWTTLFLVVALHGIALTGIFIFRSKGRKAPNILLGFFLLLFSLNLIIYVAFWTGYSYELPHLLGLAAPFHFLYGPMLFLYALSVMKPERTWKKWDAIHFLPVLAYLIFLFPIYFQTGAEKAAIIKASIQTEFVLSDTARVVVTLKSLHMALYAGWIGYLSRSFGRSEGLFNRISENKRSWMQIIGGCFGGFVLSYILFFTLVETIGYDLQYDYVISFAMSVFIFAIGYLGFSSPEYLREAHNGAKYERSSLDQEEADRYLERLLSFMEQEKPYLDGDMKLDTLAEQLSIPSHHLSRIINEGLNKNFAEFVNHYRVEEAKKMLSDTSNGDYKILRVAFESGFNNKTTFNNAFKKEVGMTPSEYRSRRPDDE